MARNGVHACTATGTLRRKEAQQYVETPSGQISYVENGTGNSLAALFVHGVLLNGYLWRHQLTGLGDTRRCIAVDLLAHGSTNIKPDQDVAYDAQALMLKQFLDTLRIDSVDLVGNDSGGAIAQIFAANYPERVRSFTLTDCDAHDNWPPEAVKDFLQLVARGGLKGALETMLADRRLCAQTRDLVCGTSVPRTSPTTRLLPTCDHWCRHPPECATSSASSPRGTTSRRCASSRSCEH